MDSRPEDQLIETREAIAVTSRVLKDNPKDATNLRLRAQLYRRVGKEKEALIDFNRAMLLEPGNAGCYLERAQFYEKQNKYAMALKDLDLAVRLFASSQAMPGLLFERARVYRHLHQYQPALDDLTRGIKLNPSDPWDFYNYKQEILSEQGRYEDALRQVDLAIQSDPRRSVWYLNKIGLLLKMRRNREALKVSDQAIALDPKSPYLYGARRAIFAALGDMVGEYNARLKEDELMYASTDGQICDDIINWKDLADSARAFGKVKRYAEAEHRFERALNACILLYRNQERANAGFQQALFWYVDFLVKEEKKPERAESFLKALLTVAKEKAPQLVPHIFLSIGVVRRDTGKEQEGISVLNQGIVLAQQRKWLPREQAFFYEVR